MTTATSSGVYDVFISHATPDVEAARLLRAVLEESGVRCFLAADGAIPCGATWPADLAQQIKSSSAFLLLYSESTNTSENVLKEVMLAAEFKRAIVPIRLDDTDFAAGLKYHLAHLQAIRAFPPPLTDRVAPLINQIKGVVVERKPFTASATVASTSAQHVRQDKLKARLWIAPTVVVLLVVTAATTIMLVQNRVANANKSPTAVVTPAAAAAQPKIDTTTLIASLKGATRLDTLTYQPIGEHGVRVSGYVLNVDELSMLHRRLSLAAGSTDDTLPTSVLCDVKADAQATRRILRSRLAEIGIAADISVRRKPNFGVEILNASLLLKADNEKRVLEDALGVVKQVVLDESFVTLMPIPASTSE